MSSPYDTIKSEIAQIMSLIGLQEVKGTLNTDGWKIRSFKENVKNYWREVSFEIEILFESGSIEHELFNFTEEGSFMYELKQSFTIVGSVDSQEADEGRFKTNMVIMKAYN